MSGCGEVPELPEWYTLDVSNIFGLPSGGVRFGAGWYSSVNLLWVEILYSMASVVWAMVEGGWYGVGGCCVCVLPVEVVVVRWSFIPVEMVVVRWSPIPVEVVVGRWSTEEVG